MWSFCTLHPIVASLLMIDVPVERCYWFLCGFQEVNATVFKPPPTCVRSPVVSSTTRGEEEEREREKPGPGEGNVTPRTTDTDVSGQIADRERRGVVREAGTVPASFFKFTVTYTPRLLVSRGTRSRSY